MTENTTYINDTEVLAVAEMNEEEAFYAYDDALGLYGEDNPVTEAALRDLQIATRTRRIIEENANSK